MKKQRKNPDKFNRLLLQLRLKSNPYKQLVLRFLDRTHLSNRHRYSRNPLFSSPSNRRRLYNNRLLINNLHILPHRCLRVKQ